MNKILCSAVVFIGSVAEEERVCRLALVDRRPGRLQGRLLWRGRLPTAQDAQRRAAGRRGR